MQHLPADRHSARTRFAAGGFRSTCRRILPLLVALSLAASSLLGLAPGNRKAEASAAAPKEMAPLAAPKEMAPLAAAPVVTLSVPSPIFIGQDFSFTATFDNASPTDVGYGPYIDLVFPVTGADGAGAAIDDGITFVSATYLGAAVTSTVLPFPAPLGCVTHPYAVDNTGQPLQVCGTVGDELVVLQLPFGSFTNDQPPAAVTVNATLSNLADLGTPLTLSGQGGFRFGNDPLANPADDPTVVGPVTTANVTPQLITLVKTYSGPEDETATGPNYPRQYTISVAIAPGQTVTNLDVSDLLPDNMAFLSVVSTSPSATIVLTPNVGSAANPPYNELKVRFASVTGSGGTDATVTFEYFIPRLDASNAAVIDPATGDDVISENQAKAVGDWTPLDPRDPGGTGNAVADPPGPEHVLTDKSIAIQKGVADVADVYPSGPSPDDVLEYSLNFQVSDFFAFQSLVITDTLSDGQRFDPSYPPELQVNGNTFALAAAAIAGANFDVVPNYTPDSTPPNDGTTTLIFRVSDELISRGRSDGQLLGGCVPPAGGQADCGAQNDGATTAIIRFHTIIQHQFSDDYPSGEPNVDQGDVLDNQVTVEGDVLNNATLAPTGFAEADGSAAGLTIVAGALAKSIYAINGSTTFATPVEVKAGDLVTYRIRYDQPLTDFDTLKFIDFLPLPVFHVTELTAFVPGAAQPPPAGVVTYGPADTYHTLPGATTPAFSTNAGANSFTLDFGTFSTTANTGSVIDLLFTVTVRHDPFADGLFLTNQVRSINGTTNAGNLIEDAIVQIRLTEPLLKYSKGAVATDNPVGVFTPATVGPVSFTAPGSGCPRFSGQVTSTNLAATPIQSNLGDVDAGDLVTFAIVVENSGSGLDGAFDVRVRDTLPAGFVVPPGGLNVCVSDGSDATGNNIIPFTNIGGGLLDPAGGIELTDPGPTDPPAGAIDPFDATSGRNIAVITFDLLVDGTVQPKQKIDNTAQVFHYSGSEGGPDFAAAGFGGEMSPGAGTAGTTIASPSLTKALDGTNQGHTSGSQVAVGEIITYTVTITVPEGTSPSASLTDVLDAGLAFVDCVKVEGSPGLSTSLGTFGQACTSSNPTVSNQGRSLVFDFGTVTNSNTNNATAETITVTYKAVVLNSPGNVRGTNLNNAATWAWSLGSTGGAAPNVTVVEPTLQVSKGASPTSGDAGDVITFTLTIAHTGSSNADAFNASLSDVIPAGMTYVAGSLSNTGGLAPTTLSDSGGTMAADWNAFPLGSSSTLRFKVRLDATVTPNQSLTNLAALKWTSLPGTVTSPQSTYNTLSTERTGSTSDPGGAANTYAASGSATVTVTNVVPTKSIAATSEAFTGVVGGVERVAIGEVVRYHLVVMVPEAGYADAQLRDQLPAGLRFLNDGTAMVAFISNGPGLTSTTITSTLPNCAGLNITGASPNVTPTCPLPDAAVSSSPTINDDTFASGTDPYFKLGDVLNSDSDVDSEYVVVDFNAIVENVSGNQSGTSRDNNFQVLTGATVLATSSPDLRVTVAEPIVTLVKSVTTSPTDAGDTVVFKLLLTNTASGNSAAPAFDLSLSDTLNGAFVFGSLSGVTTGGACGSTPSTFSGGALAQVVTGTVTCLNPGATATMTITGTVAATASTGQTVANSASLTYTSLPGAGTCANATGSCAGTAGSATGERTGADGVGGALNDYAAVSAVNVPLAAPTANKMAPNPLQYTIGATIVYTVAVTLPEGNTQNLRVTDNLPPGLGYVSHNVITAAAASGGLLAADYNGALAAPTCSGCTVGQSGLLTFGFGSTQTNGGGPAAGTTANKFLLQVVARVLNASTPLNQLGSTLTNTAALIYDSASAGANQSVPAGSRTVTVIEPQITTTKTVNPTGGVQAGDIVTYTVVLANTGNSPAYDVTARDTLAQGIAFASLVSCTLNPGAINLPGTATPGSGFVDLDGSPSGSWDIPVGSALTCIYETMALSSLYVNGSHTNSIDADWTSLNGAVAGERVYDDTPGYTVDGTQDTASAAFSVGAPQFAKSDGGLTQATIGDTLHYTLTITSPLGTVRNLVVTDTLPAGLIYNGDQAVSGISTVPTFAAGVPNDGSAALALSWTFGDAVVTSSPARITFSARVANVMANQHGVSRTNQAALGHNNALGVPQPPLSASDGFQVVEPVLRLSKALTGAASPPDAGGIVTYTVLIDHAAVSGATAYDAVFADSIPSGLTNPAVVSVTASGIPTPSAQISGGVLRVPNLADGSFDLPLGASVTVKFQAQIASTVTPSQNIRNTGDVTWSSQKGAAVDERTSGDGLLNAGGLNDYEVQASAEFVTAGYGISKALDSTSAAHTTGSNVTIGEVVTYTLAIDLPEGTMPSLKVVDKVPAGMGYIGGSVVVDATGFNGVLPAATVTPMGNGADGQDVEIDFSTITVAADNDPDNNGFVIRLRCRVLDVAGNHGLPPGQTLLTNSATAQVAAGVVAESSTVTTVVVEPQVTIVKDIDPVQAAANGVVTVTLTFANAGTATGFEVAAQDTLPTGLTYDGGLTYVSGVTPLSLQESGGTVSAAWTSLQVNETSTIRFRARLDGNVVNGQVIKNTATVTQATTLPGQDAGERFQANVTDDAAVTVIAPDLELTKDDGQGSVEPGALVVYGLTVHNSGPVGATGVVISDTVPLHTVFNTAGSSAGWSCADGAAANTTCQYSVGTLAASGTTRVQFAVKVDLPAPGATSITNLASVRDDGSHGADPTPDNNRDDDVNSLVTASIGDLVWWDADGSGSVNGGESGIDNVTLDLFTGACPGVGGPLATATTAAGGAYVFNGLASGTYCVAIDPAEFQAGGTLENWSPTVPNPAQMTVILGAGQANTTTDFGVNIVSSYQVTKTLYTRDPVRPGEPISFTIRITNTGGTWITTLPLEDTYNNTFLTYGFGGDFATPDSTDHANDGVIAWTDVTTDLGDLAPKGGTATVTVWFTARDDTTTLQNGATLNTATVKNAVADPDGAQGPLPPVSTPLPAQESEAGVRIQRPTGLGVYGFSATPVGMDVVVRWKTASESSIAGFVVLRSENGGDYAALNQDLIAAQSAGSNTGNAYEFVDRTAPGSTPVAYKVEVMTADGRNEEVGPASLEMQRLRVFAPVYLQDR